MSAAGRWSRRCRGSIRVPYLTNVTMMDLDFVPPHLARRRRKLRGTGVRADVPPLRQPRHRGGDGAAPGGARGRGRVAGDPGLPARGRHRAAARRGVHQRAEGGRGAFRRPGLQGGRAARARHASAARRRPRAQHRRSRPGSRRHHDRQARLHRGRRRRCAPPIRTSGRSATATARVPSPTPLTTTTRSSPTTCSRTPAASTPTGCPCMRSTPTRRSGGSA